MRNHIVCAVAVLAPHALGQVREFTLPEGYRIERVIGVSDTGTVGATLTRLDPYGWGAFMHGSNGWTALHPDSSVSRLMGLSADGGVTLSMSVAPGGVFVRGGFGSVSLPADGPAALSSDGRTVLLGSAGGAGGPSEVRRWRDGVITPVLTLPDRYMGTPGLLAGASGDVFVVNADIGVYDAYTTPRRVLRADAGGLTELGTLMNAAFVESTATAMSGDGSVIAGLERAWDGPGDADRFDSRAWVWRDGVMSELLLDGFSDVVVRGMSSDGSALLGVGRMLDGAYDRPGSVLVHADGRTESVESLLIGAGVSFGAYGWATAEAISADGLTVAGSIWRFDAAGEWSSSLFTLTVPGPGGLTMLAGLGVLAARRRR